MNIAKLKLQALGHLKPDTSLLAEVATKGVDLNDFCGGADAPQAFVEFLAQHGLEPREKNGMLFAHNAGVGLHEDEHPIACWFLSGMSQRYCGDKAIELIVAGASRHPSDGEVIYFDARQKHGVISCVTTLWSCFSIYVRPIKKPRPSSQPKLPATQVVH